MGIDRYIDVEVVKDSQTNKRMYATKIFPTIPLQDSDIFIVSRDGDRLDMLAHRFYSDSTLWWVIASANSLSDSFYVPPGTKLRIPIDIQYVLSYVKTINDER